MDPSLPRSQAALARLAHAMLVGYSLGCPQVRHTYWKPLGIRSDGAVEYGFCAIGCANIGLLGYVPRNINAEVYRLGEHFMGREPLERALDVNWNSFIVLPDGSHQPLLQAVSQLNDRDGWSVPLIAVWLLMIAGEWDVSDRCLHRQLPDGETVFVTVERYIEAIQLACQECPTHTLWHRFVDPASWQVT